jgi:uncharacterized protein (TIGR03083 family)
MNWIAAIEHEGHALSVAARHDPKAAVPSCPGWDVDELLRHTSYAHHNALLVVSKSRTERPDLSEFTPPHGDALGWYETGLAALLDACRAADPTTPVYTFVGTGPTEFWFRRMAHETAVHRIDAEQATGAETPMSAELAVDGIDEMLGSFLPMLARRKETDPSPGTVHLHTTDVEGEWLVNFGETITVERGHAKGDTAVRGSAADLYLWLWGRRPIDGLEVFGEVAQAERLRTTVTV